MTRDDLLIEALAGAVAAAVTLAAIDSLQVARRVSDRVGPHGPAPRRQKLIGALEARGAEAFVAMLVFRLTMGGGRRLLRRLIAPAHRRPEAGAADWTAAPTTTATPRELRV